MLHNFLHDRFEGLLRRLGHRTAMCKPFSAELLHFFQEDMLGLVKVDEEQRQLAPCFARSVSVDVDRFMVNWSKAAQPPKCEGLAFLASKAANAANDKPLGRDSAGRETRPWSLKAARSCARVSVVSEDLKVTPDVLCDRRIRYVNRSSSSSSPPSLDGLRSMLYVYPYASPTQSNA
ncbi:hypothetical protein AYO21_09258 [Fonsecaea monophora]|uniref:Uncharacterized protein n=1 Tax=Fonsecaea monophora TaxID=254056 RepID=A0A177EWU7_9EURO|nr:hypothetical protein AYO21_09258 [Fonsecaea monophora]OAG36527.1 hypothetical protein AYO21_09258 [Fonsecaea monophora]